MAKRAKINTVMVSESAFQMNRWRLGPAISYWTGKGKSEHSVNIRQMPAGDFMVLVVKGTMKDHQHATGKFPKDVLEAMKIAEGLIGPGGKWLLSSFLEYATKDGDMALVAGIHALGTEKVQLSAIATPLTPLKASKSSRGAVDAGLAHHALDLTEHKNVPAALRAAPAALRRVAKAARCECTEICEPKKRAKR